VNARKSSVRVWQVSNSAAAGDGVIDGDEVFVWHAFSTVTAPTIDSTNGRAAFSVHLIGPKVRETQTGWRRVNGAPWSSARCPRGQWKKQRALASVLGDPAISFEPLLSDIPLVVAHLPFPFRLAVLDNYQFVHGSGGRTSRSMQPRSRTSTLYRSIWRASFDQLINNLRL
jgi:hypothetical protein